MPDMHVSLLLFCCPAAPRQTLDLKAGLDALTAEILQLDDDLNRTGLEVVMDVLGGGVLKVCSVAHVMAMTTHRVGWRTGRKRDMHVSNMALHRVVHFHAHLNLLFRARPIPLPSVLPDRPAMCMLQGAHKAGSDATVKVGKRKGSTSSTRDGSTSTGRGSNTTLSSAASADRTAAAVEVTDKTPGLAIPPVVPVPRPPLVSSTTLHGPSPVGGGRSASAFFPTEGKNNRVAPERSGTSLFLPKAVPPVSIDMANATDHTAGGGAQPSARSNDDQAARTSGNGQAQRWPALETVQHSRVRGSGSGSGVWHV
jgi:hypothetical protein